MLVLRPVVHEQEQPGGTETLDQAVQQRLSLAVDPVEVLEDHHERLLAGLPEEQTLHAVESLPPPLLRDGRLPWRILHRHIEQGKERREGWLESAVQG